MPVEERYDMDKKTTSGAALAVALGLLGAGCVTDGYYTTTTVYSEPYSTGYVTPTYVETVRPVTTYYETHYVAPPPPPYYHKSGHRYGPRPHSRLPRYVGSAPRVGVGGGARPNPMPRSGVGGGAKPRPKAGTGVGAKSRPKAGAAGGSRPRKSSGRPTGGGARQKR